MAQYEAHTTPDGEGSGMGGRRPAVSIVIPTAGRHEYLAAVVRTILRNTDDVEIVVSDNSELRDFESEFAAEIGSGRVVYVHTAEPISVVANFEVGVALATGEYVTCLGDDDCIGPGFEDVVHWASRNQLDAVTCYTERFIAVYFWPGVQSKYFGDAYQAKLSVKRYTGESRQVDGMRSLQDCASKLGGGLGEMPRIYHGLVRRDLLDRIRQKYGAVFGGVSPDIYSAALISVEAKSVYHVDAPFLIPGGSVKSTAGLGAARQDRGNLRTVEHVRRFGESLRWSPLVPEYYAPYNVWAYSILAAIGKAAPAVRPNYMRLYLRAALADRQYTGRIFDSMKVAVREYGYIASAWDGVTAACGEVAHVLRRIYWRYVMKSTDYPGLDDIGKALERLQEYERATGFRLADHLKSVSTREQA